MVADVAANPLASSSTHRASVLISTCSSASTSRLLRRGLPLLLPLTLARPPTAAPPAAAGATASGAPAGGILPGAPPPAAAGEALPAAVAAAAAASATAAEAAAAAAVGMIVLSRAGPSAASHSAT